MDSQVQGRATVIQLALTLLAGLPLNLLRGIGILAGELLWRLPTRARATTLTNLALCFPQQPEQQRKALARASLRQTAQTFVEMAAIWHWSPDKVERCIQQVSGEQHLQHALRQGQGVIILAPHIGQWEVLNAYVGQRYPLTALYRPPRLAALDNSVRQARQRFGGQLVPTNPQGVKQLFKALKQGQVVGILPDQEPGKGHGAGVFAPFFGVSAWTMILLSRLAHKSGAQVIMGSALRQATGFYIDFTPVDASIRDADLTTSATTLNQAVERAARQDLSQYQWSYKRFKTRPPGQSKPYSK